MAVSVRIPTPLRKLTQGKEELQLEATTVRELLDQLEKAHPGIREHLCDEEGRFRRFVNVYLNGEDIRYLRQEQTPLKAGDEVAVIPAIAGGAS
jgi:molybdopterin synthase sulfur carrier subunit